MMARLLTSRTCFKSVRSIPLFGVLGLHTHYLIGNAAAILSASASNDQIAAIVGVPFGGVDGIGERVFRIGDARFGGERHDGLMESSSEEFYVQMKLGMLCGCLGRES